MQDKSINKKSFVDSRGLNSFALKIIAILVMTLDHIGILLYIPSHPLDTTDTILSVSAYTVIRSIGRLAFPIFCYMLAEGLVYTRNVWKYTLRLFCFAILSLVPYNLAFHRTIWYNKDFNIFFTLALGLLTITIVQGLIRRLIETKSMLYFGYGTLVIFAATGLAEYFHLSYGQYGIWLILIFYLFRIPEEKYNDEKYILLNTLLQAALMLGISYLYRGDLQYYAVLALVLFLFYNRKKGPSLKYLFYIYYPLHLLVLYIAYIFIY